MNFGKLEKYVRSWNLSLKKNFLESLDSTNSVIPTSNFSCYAERKSLFIWAVSCLEGDLCVLVEVLILVLLGDWLLVFHKFFFNEKINDRSQIWVIFWWAWAILGLVFILLIFRMFKIWIKNDGAVHLFKKLEITT